MASLLVQSDAGLFINFSVDSVPFVTVGLQTALNISMNNAKFGL